MPFHLLDGFIGGVLPSMPLGNVGCGFGMNSMEALSVA
jgi:hypothetical protein